MNPFDKLYLNKHWGAGSGPGSTIAATRNVSDFIKKQILHYKIKKIVDGSCGAFIWMPILLKEFPEVEYIGNDTSEIIININKEKHKEQKNWKFYRKDVINEDIEECDLFIFRDTMMHLSSSDNIKILKNIKKNTKFALLTNHPNILVNPKDDRRRKFFNDISGGYFWQEINLFKEPYNLEESSVIDSCVDKPSNNQKMDLYRFN